MCDDKITDNQVHTLYDTIQSEITRYSAVCLDVLSGCIRMSTTILIHTKMLNMIQFVVRFDDAV